MSSVGDLVGRSPEIPTRPVTRNSTLLLVAGVAAVALFILFVDRDMRPFHDEWWFICGRSLGDIASLFRPHNEHWVTLHAIEYLGVAGVAGLSSYGVLLAPLIVAHGFVVAGVYRLTRSMMAAAVMTFLGSGYLNLFWAFQFGPVAAIALGLWSLIAFIEGRPRLGAALLAVGVATSGNSLFFIPTAAAYLVLKREVRQVLWLAAPTAAWIAWAVVEWSAIDFRGGTPTVDGVVGYVAFGVALASGLGVAILGPGFVALALAARPKRMSPVGIAAAIGLLATLAALALVRADFSGPNSPRFLYIYAPFVLVALIDLRGSAMRPLLITSALVIGLTVNVALLIGHGLGWPYEVAVSRAHGSDTPPAASCYPAYVVP